ncbi:hypothetical protein ASF32_19490 [Methylobacterium sp. Leaf91]|nr:hypothetical protein ASF24_06815 [Methylobacterium sp. Leaf86]KQO94327.1 hypothetical protein ASF32_19490 [Methylobacterium sp. Leaf91]
MVRPSMKPGSHASRAAYEGPLFQKNHLILRCGDSRLEGALQPPLRLLEPSFEAFAALRHLRMRSVDRMGAGRTEPLRSG